MAAPFVPVVVSVILLWLNIRGYYFDSEMFGLEGQDKAKTNGVQFAAKLHEMTLFASLVFIIMFSSFLRNDLYLQASHLARSSLVCSFPDSVTFGPRDLCKIAKSDCQHSIDGRFFIITLLMVMSLALVVGLSSAFL